MSEWRPLRHTGARQADLARWVCCSRFVYAKGWLARLIRCCLSSAQSQHVHDADRGFCISSITLTLPCCLCHLSQADMMFPWLQPQQGVEGDVVAAEGAGVGETYPNSSAQRKGCVIATVSTQHGWDICAAESWLLLTVLASSVLAEVMLLAGAAIMQQGWAGQPWGHGQNAFEYAAESSLELCRASLEGACGVAASQVSKGLPSAPSPGISRLRVHATFPFLRQQACPESLLSKAEWEGGWPCYCQVAGQQGLGRSASVYRWHESWSQNVRESAPQTAPGFCPFVLMPSKQLQVMKAVNIRLTGAMCNSIILLVTTASI